ncbi:RNA polymerase sigma factor RpoD/SigA [Candidatus Latescibacterota bacterium]
MSKLSKNTFSRENDTLDRYFHEIGNEVLVTKEQEIELAREIRNGSPKALDALIKSNLRFVVSVAKGYQNQGLPLCDLINEGNLGLIKAAKRFDETKGFKFISYAVWWIRQAMLSALAEQSRIVRLPLNRVGIIHKIGKASKSLEQEFGREPTANEIADELGMSPHKVIDNLNISSRHLSLDAPFNYGEDNKLLDILEDKDQPSSDEKTMENSLKVEIEKALSTLSVREAEVISLYFGINRENPLTLEDIGKIFNLTRERVRQIKEKALTRLRHKSRSKQLRTYFTELVPEY